MEAEIQETVEELTEVIRDIRYKEHDLHQRILQVSEQLHIEVIEPLEREISKEKQSWLWPFLIFLALIIAFGVFGYTRYRTVMKTHLL